MSARLKTNAHPRRLSPTHPCLSTGYSFPLYPAAYFPSKLWSDIICDDDRVAHSVLCSRPVQIRQITGAPYQFPILVRFLQRAQAKLVKNIIQRINIDATKASIPQLLKDLAPHEQVWHEASITWFPIYTATAPFIDTEQV